MAYGGVPGEHDTADAGVSEYSSRFGKASNSKGYYSFAVDPTMLGASSASLTKHPRSLALTDITIG